MLRKHNGVYIWWQDMFSRLVIVPYRKSNDKTSIGRYINGGWRFDEVDPASKMDEDFFISLSEAEAHDLYEQLKKRFDPKDTVSVDAVEMQGKHLEDMRKIVFKQLHIEAI